MDTGFYRPDALSVIQPFQTTEVKSKHYLHPFLIHWLTADGRDVMLPLCRC